MIAPTACPDVLTPATARAQPFPRKRYVGRGGSIGQPAIRSDNPADLAVVADWQKCGEF